LSAIARGATGRDETAAAEAARRLKLSKRRDVTSNANGRQRRRRWNRTRAIGSDSKQNQALKDRAGVSVQRIGVLGKLGLGCVGALLAGARRIGMTGRVGQTAKIVRRLQGSPGLESRDADRSGLQRPLSASVAPISAVQLGQNPTDR
jgi:hypothetical protein